MAAGKNMLTAAFWPLHTQLWHTGTDTHTLGIEICTHTMIKYILNCYRFFGQESHLETEFQTVAQARLELVALLLPQLWYYRYESGCSAEGQYPGSE